MLATVIHFPGEIRHGMTELVKRRISRCVVLPPEYSPCRESRKPNDMNSHGQYARPGVSELLIPPASYGHLPSCSSSLSSSIPVSQGHALLRMCRCRMLNTRTRRTTGTSTTVDSAISISPTTVIARITAYMNLMALLAFVARGHLAYRSPRTVLG